MTGIYHRLLTLLFVLTSPVWAQPGDTAPEAKASAQPAQEQPHLKPFNAVYKARYHGIGVTAKRELKKLNDHDYQLYFEADSWIAKITEISQFQWRELDNGNFQLQPMRYEYHREGLGRDRHAYLDFDWIARQVKNDVENKPWHMDITDGTLDKLSYQLQLRQDLLQNTDLIGYNIADGGNMKQYSFDIIDEEWLDTPVGKLKTLKVERLRKDSNKRKTYIWFAIDWDYLIVRLQHWEDGKGYELDLHEAEVNGQTVQGQAS